MIEDILDIFVPNEVDAVLHRHLEKNAAYRAHALSQIERQRELLAPIRKRITELQADVERYAMEIEATSRILKANKGTA